LDPGGFVNLIARSDGSSPALTLRREAAGTSYVPTVSFVSPGGTPHDLLNSIQGLNSHVSWVAREDGRLGWGPGDFIDPDVFLARLSNGVLTVSGAGTNTAAFAVTGEMKTGVASVLSSVAVSPPAPAIGEGVKLFASSDGIKARAAGLVYGLRPAQADQISAYCAFDPAAANSTSLALTSGVLYLVRILITDSRALARIGMNVVGGGLGLIANQCLAGVYDSVGNLISFTGDQSVAWATAGAKNMALSSTAISAGVYYLGILSNGATGPTVSRSQGLGNWLTSGSGTRFGRYGTAQIALPVAITTASITSDTDNKFMSVS
jgi:hypothetical protein